MTADQHIVLIIGGIVIFPLMIALVISAIRLFLSEPSHQSLRRSVAYNFLVMVAGWVVGVIAITMTALLFHWIPRIGEVWAKL